MAPRKVSTSPNHRLYCESHTLRRSGTISTDRTQPTPLGASDSFNTLPEATGINRNPKCYSSLQIRLRNRWSSENTQPSATAATRSVSSNIPSVRSRDALTSTSYQNHASPSQRIQKFSQGASLDEKPLPEIMIRFSFKDAPKTTRGMPMDWLLDPKVNVETIEASMKGGADRVLDDAEGDKILLRISWMPYVADMWYRIPILNDYSNPITRAELARRIVRTYNDFMEVHTNDPFPTDRRYKCFKIGGPGMTLPEMLLHSITRLSNNEWEARVNHAGF
ncbi:hypothetical protein BJ165DRAFT_1527105 [Panaeolus papilionaceus]|nr:hypothetical protein BJ165DRAFT_1527105 [Panaeolus papilionaceus]